MLFSQREGRMINNHGEKPHYRVRAPRFNPLKNQIPNFSNKATCTKQIIPTSRISGHHTQSEHTLSNDIPILDKFPRVGSLPRISCQ